MTKLYDTYAIHGGGHPFKGPCVLEHGPLVLELQIHLWVVSFEVPKSHLQGWPNVLGTRGYDIRPSKTAVAYTTRNKAGAYI